MSDSSSDEDHQNAAEKVIKQKSSYSSLRSKKSQSSFSEDGLPKPRQAKRNDQINSRHSMFSDINSSTITQSINRRQHSRTESITFEEYSGMNRRTSHSTSRHHHKRVHSWSESSVTSSFLNGQRKSYDMPQRPPLLIGIQNQFNPQNKETPPHEKPYIKIKTKIKTNKRFTRLVLAQTLAVDLTEVYAASGLPLATADDETDSPKRPLGAIWATRFSKDGKYLATAGQSCVINIWKVLRDLERSDNIDIQDILPNAPSIKVFHDVPVRAFTGHTADILDISWSKNNFLISSSMDKTVRLWHVSQKVCLCVFKHLDVVTSVKFHPKDDRFFLSGSMDCKVRLWSIQEKRVAFWNEIPSGNMVTAVGFTLDGRTACVGANTGDVFFFETQGLKYNTQILVKNHHNKRGKKVTGIEPMPGMPLGEERILVTTNDSRIWIINMKDKSFVYKYKDFENPSMQIKASFSNDGRYIVCGSEDGCVYLWCTDQVSYSPFHAWQDNRMKAAVALGHLGGQMLQTVMPNADYLKNQYGGVTSWLKRGEQAVIDKLRSRNEHFTAHQHIVTSAIFAPTKTKQQLARSKGDIIFDNTPVYTHREVTENEFDQEPTDYGTYEDASSMHRKSISSSPSFYEDDTSRQCKNMDELRKSLMEEFEEATKEERDRFDYPDSQIIVSADVHGSIKVWRMDSGVYGNENKRIIRTSDVASVASSASSDITAAHSSRHTHLSASESSLSKSDEPISKKKTFKSFFLRK